MAAIAAAAAVLSILPSVLGAGASDDPSFVYESWRTYTTSDGLPDDAVRAVRVSDRGVWVATEGGLALGVGVGVGDERTTWTTWTTDDGLPWPDVSAIDIDARTGDVWLGTWGGGVVRASGGRFDTFDQLNSGLGGNLVFAVTVADGRVWAATNGGLSVLEIDSGEWELHLARRADVLETAVMSLAIFDGHLYAAAWCEGLRRLEPNGSSWSPVAFAAAAPPDDATVGVASVDGSLWCAAQDALLRGEPSGRWTAVPIPDHRAPGRFVRCVAAKSDSVAAVGTDRGLDVLVDPSSATWVRYEPRGDGSGTGDATLHRDGETVEGTVPVAGLPDRRVRCIAFHGEDIWVGTARGLARGTGRRPWTAHPPASAEPDAASRPVVAKREPTRVVNIGILRPGNRVITLPGSDGPGAPRKQSANRADRMDRMAAMLAIEQANARGGFRGEVPFALVTGPQGSFDGWGWTTPEDDFPALERRDDVFGIIGHVGPRDRVTNAVALATGLPVVNVSTATPTIDEIVNPWIFRCRGEDARRQRLVLDHALARFDRPRVAIVRTPDRAGGAQLDRCVLHVARQGGEVVVDLHVDPASGDLAAPMREIRNSSADAVLTCCDTASSAAILASLREAGSSQVFIGGPEIVTDEFISLAGPEPGIVIAPGSQAKHVEASAVARFSEAYALRLKRQPPPDSFALFESVNHLLEAIEAAGLDREAIQRELERMGRDPAGERHVEGPAGGPAGEVLLGRIRDGKWTLRRLSGLPPANP